MRNVPFESEITFISILRGGDIEMFMLTFHWPHLTRLIDIGVQHGSRPTLFVYIRNSLRFELSQSFLTVS